MSYGSQCLQRYWRGYDVRIHPAMHSDGFHWEPELAMVDTWLDEHANLPAIDWVEIHARYVLLVMRGLIGTIVLIKTHKGLVEETAHALSSSNGA
jgi:hypothetical protein